MSLATRREIRTSLENVSAELAELKTPQGLARYMFSKGGDDEFEEAFRLEIVRLRDEAIGAGVEPEPEPEEFEPAAITDPIGSPAPSGSPNPEG